MYRNRHSNQFFIAIAAIAFVNGFLISTGSLCQAAAAAEPASANHAGTASKSEAVELPEEASTVIEQSSFINTTLTKSAPGAATTAPGPATATTAPAATTAPGAATTSGTATAPGPKPKIGLALGGGGTRGSAHIGVLRVLEREGIRIDCISGTSIGAIVGGLYCAGVSVDQIEEMFLNKKLLHSYQTVPIWVRLAVVPVFVLPHLIGYHHYDGLYRGNKFATFIEKSVPEGCRSIENLKIPFCAVASSLLDGRPHAFKAGCLARAIQASSAIPVLRRPVEIDNDLYVDGGIIDNLPVRQARELGADIVIAVDVDEKFQKTGARGELAQFTRIGSVGNRVISMILRRVDEDSVASADVVIAPNVNAISLLSERKKEAMEAIAQGAHSAEAQLPAIRAAIAAFGKKSDAGSAPILP